MKKNPKAADSPRVRLVAPTAALATGLLSTSAWTAPGDLDPSFGDVGRVSGLPNLEGAAWALEVAEDQDVLFAGYDGYCYYYSYDCDFTGFSARLDQDGGLETGFAVAELEGTDVRDIALQSDGKAVAVGTSPGDASKLVVFRLNRDGSLDAGFGTNGVVRLENPAGVIQAGHSLALEPDGRITVAGLRFGKLLVLRLLADGALDPGFGTDGYFLWESGLDSRYTPRLVRLGGGDYRVIVNPRQSAPTDAPVFACRVLALTSSGALDPAFGSGGLSGDVVSPTAAGNGCSSLVAQPDGRVVVAGAAYNSSTSEDAEQAFVARLLSTGAPDPLFNADSVPTSLARVTALAVGGAGSIAVAGEEKAGLSGAVVVRLQADGHLDAIFGRDGSTTIDLASEFHTWTTVHDMQVLADGAIVMAGRESVGWVLKPFVARLLGDAAGGGPGILGVKVTDVAVQESDGSATVVVRRTGGATGAVSVAYAAVAGNVSGAAATADLDFTAVQGSLSWADGDYGDRELTVPIANDGSSPAERQEQFYIRLSAADGGAGIGTSTAIVNIVGDSYPFGTLSIDADVRTRENGRFVHVYAYRSDYSAGTVSVGVNIADGTALNGEDYATSGVPTRLTWGDGDSGPKIIAIPLLDDGRNEPLETFTVTLTGAEGGALIDQQSSATVTISDDDRVSSGGGGRAGGLFALLAGVAGLVRRRRSNA